jgi:hypothetical protein
MSWRYTLTSVLAAMLILSASGASALTIETAVMPGPVIQGHAKLEGDCGNCHERFDRAAQPGLCLGCHKPVRADVIAKTGYHGRLSDKERECRHCHTDHKGRQARIVVLREHEFDHRRTDFELAGKHKLQACTSCHRPGMRHSQAPSECVACHRKDDKHKGGLGANCSTCHDENDWKHARFDHAKTKFPLRRAHAQPSVRCESCHAGQKFKGTPQECGTCHREDDMTKGHKGHFGSRCEKCHDEGAWKTPTFRHDRDTAYPLVDRHRAVKCENCHRAPLFREKTSTRCVACHRPDDVHKGSLGERCDKCHSPRGWKTTAFNHDADTRFALRERHKAVACTACHKDQGMREKLPLTCVGCHERDDREKGHGGRLGDQCDKCHNPRGWKTTAFDHETQTHFPLRDRHKAAACTACHKDQGMREKLPLTCFGCHEGDDRDKGHRGHLGPKCESCHDTRGFKHAPLFDHARDTPFSLAGKHARIECVSCHKEPLLRTRTDAACYGCHKDQDVHFETYGLRCETCHLGEDWRKIKPDAPAPAR